MKILISRASGFAVEHIHIPLKRVFPIYVDDQSSWQPLMYSAEVESLEDINMLADITKSGIIYSRIVGYDKILFPDFDYKAIIYDSWVE